MHDIEVKGGRFNDLLKKIIFKRQISVMITSECMIITSEQDYVI